MSGTGISIRMRRQSERKQQPETVEKHRQLELELVGAIKKLEGMIWDMVIAELGRDAELRTRIVEAMAGFRIGSPTYWALSRLYYAAKQVSNQGKADANPHHSPLLIRRPLSPTHPFTEDGKPGATDTTLCRLNQTFFGGGSWQDSWQAAIAALVALRPTAVLRSGEGPMAAAARSVVGVAEQAAELWQELYLRRQAGEERREREVTHEVAPLKDWINGPRFGPPPLAKCSLCKRRTPIMGLDWEDELGGKFDRKGPYLGATCNDGVVLPCGHIAGKRCLEFWRCPEYGATDWERRATCGICEGPVLPSQEGLESGVARFVYAFDIVHDELHKAGPRL
ncbi:hypothetical protein MAPG_10453 [Magnaporthiopsis poae ATCC 64411]|uniref:Uncharacterized protein n=1 Tax=Magnaporthiopsis poae (strain ATCC 64411 / 73-15) TaxID=644358 RepID=A0A0C4ECM2_MAGP6|nr:hypothetical protein MAPG_10453 [Magnaporthiopsis poae ATCC 64411]